MKVEGNEEHSQQAVRQVPKEYQWLKKSDKIDVGFFVSDHRFDLRFPELKGSLVDQALPVAAFTALKGILGYKKHPFYTNKPFGEEYKQLLDEKLPMVKPDFKHEGEAIKYTWIGHSTAVLQIGQEVLIIDPVFSERSSLTQWLGPKRYRPPACTIPELPDIDMVLVSHDHYDHLDYRALCDLQKLYKPKFVAGLESDSVFPPGCSLITMDWMDQQEVVINGKIYKITFVPVCHWSRRGANDYNKRLWGGFVIDTPYQQRLFYSGDTGYCGVFKEIGDMFGPFDLCILPIGAYQPRQLLKAQHVNPAESVLVHKELKSKKSVGVHWGTFPLGRQYFFQAREDLEKAKEEQGLNPSQFITLRHGDSIVI